MKKDVITIITLLILIVLLSGGIFFVVKNDIFSSKSDDSVLKNEENANSNENDSINNENEKEDSEQNKEEEKVETEEPSKTEEPKKVEKPKVETPTINKLEVNKPSSVITNKDNNNQNQENNNNNNQNNNNDNNQNTDPKPIEPPVLLSGGTLTCVKISTNEDSVFTHTVVGVFDTTDAYINTYKESYVFDFSEYYEPFTDEDRLMLEESLKQDVMDLIGSASVAFTFTTSSRENIISLNLVSDRDRLKSMAPDGFTVDGIFYYENFKYVYESSGYTCS